MKYDNGLKYTHIETVQGRQRVYNGEELVGLSCGACKKTKGLNEFNKNKNNFAGKQSRCRVCDRKKTAKWESENQERALERAIRNTRKRRTETPHKVLADYHNTRARQAGTEADLHYDESDILLATAGVRLVNGTREARCQVTGEWTSKFHVCHMQSIDRGGDTSKFNLFVATAQVNKLQGAEHLFDWLLSERAQELASKEHVKWLLEYHAQIRQHKDVRSMLNEHYENDIERVSKVRRLLELYVNEPTAPIEVGAFEGFLGSVADSGFIQ